MAPTTTLSFVRRDGIPIDPDSTFGMEEFRVLILGEPATPYRSPWTPADNLAFSLPILLFLIALCVVGAIMVFILWRWLPFFSELHSDSSTWKDLLEDLDWKTSRLAPPPYMVVADDAAAEEELARLTKANTLNNQRQTAQVFATMSEPGLPLPPVLRPAGARWYVPSFAQNVAKSILTSFLERISEFLTSIINIHLPLLRMVITVRTQVLERRLGVLGQSHHWSDSPRYSMQASQTKDGSSRGQKSPEESSLTWYTTLNPLLYQFHNEIMRFNVRVVFMFEDFPPRMSIPTALHFVAVISPLLIPSEIYEVMMDGLESTLFSVLVHIHGRCVFGFRKATRETHPGNFTRVSETGSSEILPPDFSILGVNIPSSNCLRSKLPFFEVGIKQNSAVKGILQTEFEIDAPQAKRKRFLGTLQKNHAA
ncbi:hypothetical protein C8R43DRAFT_962704 [Mycena crocata]|nr:hypothetical protein C8R43DRAFT_962704 [Mycena crocata]